MTTDGYLTSDLYEVALLQTENVPMLNHQWNGKVFVYRFDSAAEQVLAGYRAGSLEVNIRAYVENLRDARRIMADARRYSPKPQ